MNPFIVCQRQKKSVAECAHAAKIMYKEYAVETWTSAPVLNSVESRDHPNKIIEVLNRQTVNHFLSQLNPLLSNAP